MKYTVLLVLFLVATASATPSPKEVLKSTHKIVKNKIDEFQFLFSQFSIPNLLAVLLNPLWRLASPLLSGYVAMMAFDQWKANEANLILGGYTVTDIME